MTNPTRDELIRLGVSATIGGDLRHLRDQVGLTRNAQAKLMGVTPDALRRWEAVTQGMNHESALRVGEWFWAARRALEQLADDGVSITDLVPLSTASQHLAMGPDDILAKCQSGTLRCEDLGVLGMYIYRSCIPSLDK